jgi:phenylacetate-CoA ligase
VGTSRNSGVLNTEESFSLDQRVDYQTKWLQTIIELSHRAGTPLKHTLNENGVGRLDIRTIEDLRKIPILKKKDLSEAQKANPPFGNYVTIPSSDLLRIHQSPGPIYDPVGKVPDYWRWKTALYSVGFRPGDLVINTFAYHLTPAGHMFEEGISELGGVTIPTGVGNTEIQAEILKTLQITGYIGTPSFLMAILKKAEDMNISIKNECNLQIAFLLAEMLPESMRKRFFDDFGIIGRQSYGTADVGCIAYECPATNGMHIHYDRIVEILNPETGEHVAPGDPGEVVVTCNNTIYPLVRFGTGDLSAMVEEECSCGRTGLKLTKILGRVDQLTKVKGMFIHPTQIQKIMESYPEIKTGRLLVERPGDQDAMTLEIEVQGDLAVNFIQQVEVTLREIAKIKGNVKIIPMGTLPEDHKIIEDVRKWD